MSEQRQQPSMPTTPPAQEGLFAVYTQSGYDDIASHTFSDPALEAGPKTAQTLQERTAPVVDIRERAGHLIRALDALAQVNKRRGFAIASQTPGLQEPIQRRYRGDNLQGVQREAGYNKSRFAETARSEFATAFRLGGDGGEDDAELDHAYISFKHAYGGTKNHPALVKYRTNLHGLAAIPGPKAIGDTLSASEALVMLGEGDEQESLLTTREKLIGLRDDGRASFLPTTHREKNQAIELLDYLDNPAYPGGIHDRLQQIYDHQVHIFKKQGLSHHASQLQARRTVDSVLEEYGDYLSGARHDYVQLIALRKLIHATPNPKLTLADAASDGDISFDPRIIVRYMDLRGLQEGAPFTFSFDPLVTTENRLHPTERKNKVIEDPYTAEFLRDGVEEHLDARLAKLTVAQLRSLVEVALEDQAKRGAFWKNVLSNVRFAYGRRAKEIIDAA